MATTAAAPARKSRKATSVAAPPGSESPGSQQPLFLRLMAARGSSKNRKKLKSTAMPWIGAGNKRGFSGFAAPVAVSTQPPSALSFLDMDPVPVSASPVSSQHREASFGLQRAGSSSGHRGLTAETLAECRLVSGGGVVELKFVDGRTALLPSVYLRDVCRREECFHPTTLQRKTDLRRNGLTPHTTAPRPAKVAVSEVGFLALDWEDGHRTELDPAWLLERAMRNPDSTRSEAEEMVGWDAAWMERHLEDSVRFDFEEVSQGGHVTAAWLAAVRRYGLTLLSGARTEFGELRRLSKALRLPLRRTIYEDGGGSDGETFTVASKPNPKNQAYSSNTLPLHTDLPFSENPPGLQLLHCIQQDDGEGGLSTFADGLEATKRLQREDAATFELLSKTPVLFEDVDPVEPPKYHMEASHPVIELAPGTDICVAVHINDGVRASVPPGQLMRGEDHCGAVEAHYKATMELRGRLESLDMLFTPRAQPGDVWVFDNRRVLHGRTSLSSSTSIRRFEGAYMEWDDINSARRLLRNAHVV